MKIHLFVGKFLIVKNKFPKPKMAASALKLIKKTVSIADVRTKS